MNKVLILCLAIVLGGCTSTDPYTGEQKTSNTAKGAGIGAIAGALVGMAVSSKSDRGKGALIGAAIGGGAGAGVGHSMDKQEAALRTKLEGTGVSVIREGNNIRLIMPGNLTFDVGSYDVRSQFYATLESVAIILKEFTQTNIRVAGHTDSTGNDSDNQTLSERRANSVGQFLITQGVMSGRVSTAGYGKRYPTASNDTAAGRETNRRVELELVSF
ncbi:hypothetical protein A9Q88_09805 [Gammaproteobacteria bacterium 50_400_T64]|nr:hypothetical protein A9Q88_09805 [Gammaproteobacteria bacterium 50_400_T64]